MKLGCYVTEDDGGNYVTSHKLNARIKIKTKIKERSYNCIMVLVSYALQLLNHFFKKFSQKTSQAKPINKQQVKTDSPNEKSTLPGLMDPSVLCTAGLGMSLKAPLQVG